VADAPPISRVSVDAFTVPTDGPEADGTLEWDSTTLVVVEIEAGGRTGLGYSYTTRAAATVVADILAPLLQQGDPFAVPAHHAAMLRSVRNVGRRGISAGAISAADTALWDLKARLLDVPLARLFGQRRPAAPIYGSGGFTSYSDRQTIEQFSGWIKAFGCTDVKMKVGAVPDRDHHRIAAVHTALPNARLMIDANGALKVPEARALAEAAGECGVVWFEEPVSSDNLAGMRALRPSLPPGMSLAAGEYAYDPYEARGLLEGCVDALQLDATRICGYSGFLAAAALAEAHQTPVSAHTAPALHLPVCLAVPGLLHVEWFHDHARIEAMLFDGAPRPEDGAIAADLSRPGHGLVFKRQDAARFAA
jgi:L-alanine-DL-glutamate epimerase-like enolase superfamily enzyme